MTAHVSHFKVAPTSFFCDDCVANDPKILQEKITIEFSEAKEEETDCYYCAISGMNRPAEVLFNGYPSCRECRKRKNVTYFVAKEQDTNQKVVVTQVSTNKDQPNKYYHKHTDSAPFINLAFDPRNNPHDRFAQPNRPYQRTHNPHMSMALPEGMMPSFLNDNSRTRKRNQLEHSMTLPMNQGGMNPLMFSVDQIGGFEHGGYSPVHQSNLMNQMGDMGISQMPNTTRHDRTKTNPIDFLKVLKSPQSTIQKPSIKMSDSKIIDFFRKINENGISSLKGQLLYSSIVDGYSIKTFYQKCEKKSPIILVISLENGFRIGGFTYKSLDPKVNEISDQLSGMMCTYDCKKVDFYPVTGAKIVCSSTGIRFGNPPDLSLNLEDLNQFFCNLELGYYDPNGKKVVFSAGEKKDWAKLIKDVAVYTFK